MALVLEAADNIAAWRAGAKHILGKTDGISNLILISNNPLEQSTSWYTRYNPKNCGSKYDNVRDVANTIFPARMLAHSSNRADFYSRYLRANERRRSAHPGSWGTYFERLIAFGESETNQLELAIASMARWSKNHKAAITLHVSSPETDGIRTRGGPCLQYIQVLCPTKSSLDLVAVYRSQDYFNKTLGNLVGLGLLQKFIASETHRAVGQLTCHSVHAFIGASKTMMVALLSA
jgi:thymidylate synthase